ncbi:MAG: DUF1501 domain-containing protein [Deltaproteobacteria bacterium]|nr:MAG: DUF1501 domain-containing protein [Deltaproteobacteria bacterium]
MRTVVDFELTRRTLLKAGLSSAALMALPWSFARRASAAVAPHFLITFIGDGGWDVTQVFDVHDPADQTDGIDVDVPQAVSGLPPSQIATVGGITYVSNPATRPAVDMFFTNWASRSAIVNGIDTRSTSHDQSRQLVLTGYLDPTRADFAVMAAHHNGVDLPLPHLLLSGASFGGPFAGLSGRIGGQLGNALAYTRVPQPSNPDRSQLAVSTVGETYIKQTLEQERLLDAATVVGARVDEFRDANDRGEKLVSLASSLPQDGGSGSQLATSLASAFRAGMTTSVTLSNVGGFDTHSDNTQQNNHWQDLFAFLNDFVNGLANTPGVLAASLLDETTIVYCSEFARTPQLNGNNGKDHHPWTSMLMVGKRVHGGLTVGMTDGNQEGVKTNFGTGQPDDTSVVIDVQNVVAGILTLVGANSSDYLPSVRPFTAMIA